MFSRHELVTALLILSVFVWTDRLYAQSRKHSIERIRPKRSSNYKTGNSLTGAPNEVLDSYGLETFGFRDESTLTEEEKKKLESYRKLQRNIGFERAGAGVDVGAGYEAAAER